MIGQQLPQRNRLQSSQNHRGIEVALIDGPHELPADSAWWQDVQLSGVISPDSGNFGCPVLACGDHCGEGASLGAQPPAWCVDGNSYEDITDNAEHSRADIPKDSILHFHRLQYTRRDLDQPSASSTRKAGLQSPLSTLRPAPHEDALSPGSRRHEF